MLRFFTIGLATMALACGAAAQSSATTCGIVDNNVGWGKGSLTSLKRVGSGGYAGSRLGFRGADDLGGGLRALFLIEHGFNADDGAAASPATFWNRQAYVGLASPWGEVLLGRQYSESASSA